MTQTTDSLTLAIPADWLPAVVSSTHDAHDLNNPEAFLRWSQDMYHEFGAITVRDINPVGRHVRYHDAAEYGVEPCHCHNVELAFTPWEAVEA